MEGDAAGKGAAAVVVGPAAIRGFMRVGGKGGVESGRRVGEKKKETCRMTVPRRGIFKVVHC